ncbi:MAG: two-component system sensor histidine kinase NtrB [Ilumatobacteraceae bacterium]
MTEPVSEQPSIPPTDTRAVLDLLEGIDAGAILLRPVFDDRERIIDAEIEWANSQSRTMWINTAGLAPGTRVRDVYFDVDEWLGAANRAWLGATSRRWIEGSPERTPWTRAIEIIRRVGDRIAELTVDRSSDQELLDAVDAVEQKYRSILDDLPLVVISSFAGRGSIEYVNPHATIFTGLPLDELRHVSTWASMIHPDDLAHIASIRAAVFTNDAWSGQVRMHRPDGEMRHVELRVRGRQGENQSERLFVLTLLDVTDRVEAQSRIQQTSHVASLARTSGAFAHEFNNLLQVIAGNLESIEADNARQHGEAALAATTRASTLVAGLLAFASGRPTNTGIVDIAEMCTRVKSTIQAGLPDTVDMVIDIPTGLPVALADETSLFQLMSQLVANAVEAMPDGGTLSIDVDETSSAACHMVHEIDERCWLRIRVGDTGRGIPTDQLTQVWEPFFSTKKGAAARGAGLGLSTVHGLVHQFEGHVEIASTLGVGTTVTVTLPGVRE